MNEVWLKAGAALITAAIVSVSADASALLLEATVEDDPLALDITYYYPYPTSYTHVDKSYAFDDDPLKAFINKPYIMPIEVNQTTVRRSMVRPRTSFVELMYHSTDAI